MSNTNPSNTRGLTQIPEEYAFTCRPFIYAVFMHRYCLYPARRVNGYAFVSGVSILLQSTILIFDFLKCSNSVVFVLFVILLILSIINITNSSIFLYRRFRIVKLFCDNFSICNDKSDRRIQMTDFKSETSTMMTEAYPMRRQNISPEWSIYSRGDHVQAETCDLIASVQPEKTVV